VNSDEQVLAQKGAGRPVYPLAERLEVLSELQCVDYLISFEEPTAHILLHHLKPDVYAKGGDYRPEEINEWDLLSEWIKAGRIELKVVSERPGRSSSEVIKRLAEILELQSEK
jgi:bifunctional ADP-heptose synthase (sugar kinase/adenylyltransferase)